MKLEREMMRGAGPTAVMHLLSGDEMYGYEIVERSRQRIGRCLRRWGNPRFIRCCTTWKERGW